MVFTCSLENSKVRAFNLWVQIVLRVSISSACWRIKREKKIPLSLITNRDMHGYDYSAYQSPPHTNKLLHYCLKLHNNLPRADYVQDRRKSKKNNSSFNSHCCFLWFAEKNSFKKRCNWVLKSVSVEEQQEQMNKTGLRLVWTTMDK